MAVQLPPTLWWVAQRSMRFLATLALAAIVLTTGAAARAVDARPVAHEAVAGTAAHEPLALCVAGESVSRPSLRLGDGRQNVEAERGAGGMEANLAGPADHIGDPIDRAAPVETVPATRPTGQLSGRALGQRAPPRL